jgi:glycine oxidase
MTSPDIAIIGGGIIGLTTAYYLAREGSKVTLLDRGDLGQEASWAGAGIIPQCDLATASTALERFRGASAQAFPGLSQELLERTGIDNGYRQSGGLEFLSTNEEGHAEEWHTDPSASNRLTPKELAQHEPSLASGLGEAFLLPNVAQVRNPRHLRALQSACRFLGVDLKAGCSVHSLRNAGNKITALVTQDGKLVAGAYLLAAGAWTEGLAGALGWRPGIQPVRGQIVLLSAPKLALRHILLWGARYVVPRGDGSILVGSTEENVGFEKRNTAVAVQELLALASRLVPALGLATLERCWSGLRPGSRDGLPYLGKVPGYDNLYVAAGHFRAGILLSPATGMAMKELMLGQAASLPLEPFRPDRP